MDGFRVAAVFLADEAAVDEGLASVAARLRADGLRVAGFLQMRQPRGGIAVRDLVGGGLYGITQDLGPGSNGCRLDPRGLAEAAGAALATLGAGADLLLIPRFGKAEEEGHGFRALIETACAAGIPVLAGVRRSSEPAWETFTGGLADRLPVDPGAMIDWCRAQTLRCA